MLLLLQEWAAQEREKCLSAFIKLYLKKVDEAFDLHGVCVYSDKSDDMQLSPEPPKALYYFSFTHTAALLYTTCKHILVCKIGGVIL